MHVVNAQHSGGHFPLDYFPRKVHYLADAKKLADEAIRHGCKSVTVDGRPYSGGKS